MEVWNTLPKPTARTKRTWFSITQLATLVVVKLPNHILTNVFAFDQNYILTSLHVGLSAINAHTSALGLWRIRGRFLFFIFRENNIYTINAKVFLKKIKKMKKLPSKH